MADGFDHPLHLMLPSFVNRDFEPGIAFRPADLVHLRRRREAIFQFDAPLKHFNLGIVEHTLDLDQIGFRNMVAWMEQGLGQIAVIGQQHEPLAVEIQPSDRKHAHRDSVQEILHGRATLRIVQGGHDVLRLVEDEIDIRLRRPQMLAVDLDVVPVRIDLGAELLHHAAVDRHAAGRDQLLSLAPRGQPCAGDEFL